MMENTGCVSEGRGVACGAIQRNEMELRFQQDPQVCPKKQDPWVCPKNKTPGYGQKSKTPRYAPKTGPLSNKIVFLDSQLA